MKSVWRRPVVSDRDLYSIRARCEYEPEEFYVSWSQDYNSWCLTESPHILVLVSEVYLPVEIL